ncbi:MAG TPA: mechanosensitive ion channel domain-containing protein [Nitrososphaerales archaeon]|nr:mechanosensitive ion channel domain-containing protein [Nitrososphaerales archaeon]
MTNPLMDIRIVSGIILIGAGVFVTEETLSFLVRRIVRRAGAGPTVTRDIGVSFRVIAAALVLSNVLSYSGLSSLFTGLTVSAVVALGISLALQTTLSNVISGLLLFSDGVLRLNDTIEYSGTKGQVVRIGLRNTWIKTNEGHITVVSNTSLSNGPLINHTATARLSKKFAFS